MKKELGFICTLDLLFILMLSFAGLSFGILSDIIYYSAFVLPILIGLTYAANLNGKDEILKSFKPGAKILAALPVMIISICLIILISTGTDKLIEYFGVENSYSSEITESFPLAIVIHALIPAVLEELLFRLIPMRLLAHHSRYYTVILSACFFSLIHLNIYQIPYAAVAGVAFMLIDLRYNSVLPSMIMHFINNIISLICIFFITDNVKGSIFTVVTVILGVISAIAIAVKHKYYKSFLDPFSDKNKKVELSYSPLIIILVCAAIMVSNAIL